MRNEREKQHCERQCGVSTFFAATNWGSRLGKIVDFPRQSVTQGDYSLKSCLTGEGVKLSIGGSRAQIARPPDHTLVLKPPSGQD